MSAETTNPSVAAPISTAIDRMRLILFQPFEFEKWFCLGFCAFLANLGDGGGGGGGGGGNWRGDHDQVRIQPALEWAHEHLLWIVLGVLGVGILLIGLMLLVCWLSSRGKFMFLDGVVRNRAAVREPWSTYAESGNRLFVFSFLLSLAGTLFLLLVLGTSVAWAWPDIRAEQFGSHAVTALACGLGVLLPAALLWWLAGTILRDFVVPAMYLRGQPVWAALSSVWQEVIQPHLGTSVLYFLMKILIGVVTGLLAFIATCLTCCIAALPYIGTVILLPLFVFRRCYALYYLQQFGPAWDCFAAGAPPPATTAPPAA